MVCGHHSAKTGSGEVQAHGLGTAPVHANEARGVAGTNFEHVGRGGIAIALQPNGALTLFKSHIASELGKTKQMNVHCSRGLHQCTQRTRRVQLGGRARASGHGQVISLCAVKVQHGGVGSCPVDDHAQAAARDRQAIDTNHPDLAGGCFEARPLTGRARCATFAGQSQCKTGIAERQAGRVSCARIEARKRLQTGAADGEQVGRDGGRCAVDPCVHTGRFAGDGQVALGLKEPKGAQAQVATGAQEGAIGGGHGEGLLAGRARGHHQVLCGVVNQLAIAGGLVDLYQQVSSTDLQTVNAFE